MNDAEFHKLWTGPQHEIIYNVGEKLVREESERHAEITAALIWQGLAVGRLEAVISSALGAKNAKNTAAETLPEILQKYMAVHNPKVEEEMLFSAYMTE